MINRKYFTFLVYALGVLTPIGLATVLTILGVRPEKKKMEVALSNWRIDECNDTFLYINNIQIQEEPNVWFALGIERDPNTRLLQRIGIVRKRGDSLAAIFTYISRGKHGIPMACYGSREWKGIWNDLNFDGRFDELIDYKNRSKMINVNGQWIQGMGREDVNTEEGIFRFDPNAGEWKHVVANPLPENQR
jgi:hypothetical protein